MRSDNALDFQVNRLVVAVVGGEACGAERMETARNHTPAALETIILLQIICSAFMTGYDIGCTHPPLIRHQPDHLRTATITPP